MDSGDSNTGSGQKDTLLFLQLVASLEQSAMMAMGKLMNPLTQKVEKDMEMAKSSIDILKMIEAKTAGNLTREEEMFLKQVLMQLQLNFLEELKKWNAENTQENKEDNKESKGDKEDKKQDAGAEQAAKKKTVLKHPTRPEGDKEGNKDNKDKEKDKGEKEKGKGTIILPDGRYSTDVNNDEPKIIIP